MSLKKVGRIAKVGTAIWMARKAIPPVKNAFNNWKKHKNEFPDLKNAKEYVEYAWKFVRRTDSGIETKIRPNGDILKYDKLNNIFSKQNKDGTVGTMFKPKGVPGKYWSDQ